MAKYLTCHFDAPDDRRFVALIGDAELDEGNVWEAIADPITQGYGNVMWIVDLNRQSLDRVVPGVRASRLQQMFDANDWHVTEAKYGQRLQHLFAAPGGDALRAHLDAMPNERYQSLFGLPADQVRGRFYGDADPTVTRLLDDLDDQTLRDTVTNLGGHDLVELRRCYDKAASDPRPSVVFAYTVKGWGLPMAGDRLNHAALLTGDQIGVLRDVSGLDASNEWDRFPDGSPAAAMCAQTAARLHRPPMPTRARPAVPAQTGITSAKPISTQEAFGRVLVGLGREPEVAPRIVTTSPDVSVSTNLGGWVNKVGVFAPDDVAAFDDGATVLRWNEGPTASISSSASPR